MSDRQVGTLAVTGRVYKDRRQNALYTALLLAAADPKSELYYNGQPHRGAGHRCAFWDGYDGLKRSANAVPRTLSWAAFMAGRDYRKAVDRISRDFDRMVAEEWT